MLGKGSRSVALSSILLFSFGFFLVSSIDALGVFCVCLTLSLSISDFIYVWLSFFFLTLFLNWSLDSHWLFFVATNSRESWLRFTKLLIFFSFLRVPTKRGKAVSTIAEFLTLVNLTPDDLKSDPDLGYDSPRLKPYYYKFWLKIEEEEAKSEDQYKRKEPLEESGSSHLLTH